VRAIAMVSLALALSVASVATAMPASAGTIDAHIVDHILTVTGTPARDAVVIRCRGGRVVVNGARPGSAERCSELRRIIVFAGDGPDRLVLSTVSRQAFDVLRSVYLAGEAGADTIIGSERGDHIDGGRGADSLRGGRGSDTLVPGRDDAAVFGGEGVDRVRATGNGDWSITQSAVSSTGPAAQAIRIASIERIAIVGGPGANTFEARHARADLTVSGRRGDDRIVGGRGRDRFDGGDGADVLSGREGDDVLVGGRGADVLSGGAGDDQLLGGGGHDSCRGGPGADSTVSC
jgi:Ca2+-binding RTX toxin-like protein